VAVQALNFNHTAQWSRPPIPTLPHQGEGLFRLYFQVKEPTLQTSMQRGYHQLLDRRAS
jgi:hypothetical protein